MLVNLFLSLVHLLETVTFQIGEELWHNVDFYLVMINPRSASFDAFQ